MRRRDRHVTKKEEIDATIAGSEVLRLALAVNDEPYLVPLSFGYDGDAIYIHTACQGKKVDYFETNDRVCFEFERNVQFVFNSEACESTFSFETVIGYGRIGELLDTVDKAYALNQIASHYTDQRSVFDRDQVDKVRAWKISIDSMDGKRVPRKEE